MLMLQAELIQSAHLEVGIGVFDDDELALTFGRSQELAQVSLGGHHLRSVHSISGNMLAGRPRRTAMLFCRTLRRGSNQCPATSRFGSAASTGPPPISQSGPSSRMLAFGS